MKRFYTVFTLIVSSLMLVSYSANPPNGKTGAPGDGLCIDCHTQANPLVNGEISVEGFPASITPGESYLLTVVNRNTLGPAVKGGFQLTILGPNNTKAGDLSMASSNSVITVANNRQYFEHNPALAYPDSNVLKWTVEWTAPMMDSGSEITWYAAGNIANGDSKNTGDKVVTAIGSGAIILAGTRDLAQSEPTLFPNPGTGHISIILGDGTIPNGTASLYGVMGNLVGEFDIQEGRMQVSDIPSGLYTVQIQTKEKIHVARWTKI